MSRLHTLVVCLMVIGVGCRKEEVVLNKNSVSASVNRPVGNTVDLDVMNRENPFTHVDSDRAKNAVKPYVDAATEIGQKTQDPDAIVFGMILQNATIGRFVFSQEHCMIQPLIVAPDANKPSVNLVDTYGAPEGCNRYMRQDFIASYDPGINMIRVRSNIPSPRVLKGLVMLHEMKHFFQFQSHAFPLDAPLELMPVIEVQAYDFEFGLLAKLGIPGFDELLKEEMDRVRDAVTLGRPIKNNLENPKIVKVFGAASEGKAQQFIATELFMMAMFSVTFELGDMEKSFAMRTALVGKMQVREMN